MTKEKMIEAMAGLEGLWAKIPRYKQMIGGPQELNGYSYPHIDELPNYLTDKNATHRVKMKLSDAEFIKYCIKLCSIIALPKDPEFIFHESDPMECIEFLMRSQRSGAAQETEAILKAKGLWEEQANEMQ